MSVPRPPRPATWLLGLLVRRDQREFALGDLEEEFGSRCARDGVGAARRWVWGEAMRAGGARRPRARHRTAGLLRAVRRVVGPGVLSDVRFATRTAARRPATTMLLVGTLSIGIGATTAVFSVVDRVLFRGLPFEGSSELVDVWNTYPGWRGQPVLDDWWDRIPLAYPEYEDWRSGQRVFREIAVYAQSSMALTGAGDPVVATVGRASPSLWPLLGVTPAAGRFFSDDDAADVAVLDNATWQLRWGGDPDILGRTIRLDDRPFEVIGVLPPGFRFGSVRPAAPDIQIWRPAGGEPDDRERGNHTYEAIGRLRSGVPPADVEAETRRLLGGGAPTESRDVRITPRHAEIVGEARAPLLLTLSAVGLLMLLACVNVATLLLGGVAGRRAELATRATLGARPGRLVRQLLVEALVFGLTGVAGGLAVGAGALRLLVRWAPPELGIPPDIALDGRVLVFAAAVGLGSSLLFGMVPALVVRRLRLEGEIRRTSGRVLGGGGWTQRALIAAQFAISLLLLVGTGLLVRSLATELSVDPGFRDTGVLTADVRLPENRYPTAASRSAFLDAVTARLSALPGVALASATSGLPLSRYGDSSSFDIAGREVGDGEKKPEALRRSVLPGFHEALGIPILRGRGLEPADRDGAPEVTLISEAMEARFWPGESAIGEAIIRDGRRWEIVGVVGDVLYSELTAAVEATFYTPLHQEEAAVRSFASFVVQTRVAPGTLAGSVREVVHELDPALPIERLEPLSALVARSTASERYRSLLLAAVATIATLLAGIGVFGVAVRSIATRRREMGIRVAVGAEPARLLREELVRESIPLALGIVVGLGIAIAATRLLTGFLFGVGPLDPISLGLAIGGLALVGLFATFAAARRLLGLDPVDALRAD